MRKTSWCDATACNNFTKVYFRLFIYYILWAQSGDDFVNRFRTQWYWGDKIIDSADWWELRDPVLRVLSWKNIFCPSWNTSWLENQFVNYPQHSRDVAQTERQMTCSSWDSWLGEMEVTNYMQSIDSADGEVQFLDFAWTPVVYLWKGSAVRYKKKLLLKNKKI